MWTDIHAHFDNCDDALFEQLVCEAAQSGVTAIINTATSISGAISAVRRANPQRGIYAAAAISPFDVHEAEGNWQEKIENLLTSHKVKAIGETGLDKSNPRYPSIEIQTRVFEAHVEIARKHNLPAVIHSRGAERMAADICRSHGLSLAVFHCFTGTVDDLRHILDCGYHVSFSGIITFKNNPLAEQVRFAPFDRIFIETDTPYLAPVPHRGKPNRPAFLPLIGKALAACKGITIEEASQQIARNVKDVFNIEPVRACAE